MSLFPRGNRVDTKSSTNTMRIMGIKTPWSRVTLRILPIPPSMLPNIKKPIIYHIGEVGKAIRAVSFEKLIRAKICDKIRYNAKISEIIIFPTVPKADCAASKIFPPANFEKHRATRKITNIQIAPPKMERRGAAVCADFISDKGSCVKIR